MPALFSYLSKVCEQRVNPRLFGAISLLIMKEGTLASGEFYYLVCCVR